MLLIEAEMLLKEGRTVCTTLRLVRVRIGAWTIEGLDQGQWKEVPARL